MNCCCSHYKELTSGCSTFTAVAPGVVAHPLLSQNPLRISSYSSSTHLQVPGSTRDFLPPGKMMASYLLTGEKVARNPLMYSDLHTQDALTHQNPMRNGDNDHSGDGDDHDSDHDGNPSSGHISQDNANSER